VEGTLLLGADIVIAVYLEAGTRRGAAHVHGYSQPLVQHSSAPHGSDLATQADVVIEPDVKPFVWDDFTKTPEMVAGG